MRAQKRERSGQLAARSLPELLQRIFEVKQTWEDREENVYLNLWFRGQSDADKPLVPSLYRYDEAAEVDENTYRHDFALRAYPYLQNMQAVSQWERYALMQHYGLPTRLLDWSEAALIAAQFAVGGREVRVDAAVWILDPLWFNGLMVKDEYVFRPGDDEADRYLPDPWEYDGVPATPIAIEVPFNSPRIAAQRGVFTIHGTERAGLETYGTPATRRCAKIVIPRQHVLDVRRQLRTVGVSDTSVYPDLQGYCAELWHTWVEERVVEVPPETPPAAATQRPTTGRKSEVPRKQPRPRTRRPRA